jgi:hypothetical protein
VDVVLDLVGGETRARSFEVLKAGGYLVATVPPPPSEDEAGTRQMHAMLMRMQPSTPGLVPLAELLDAGTIRAVVAKMYPLSQVHGAWIHLMSGHTRALEALRARVTCAGMLPGHGDHRQDHPDALHAHLQTLVQRLQHGDPALEDGPAGIAWQPPRRCVSS